MYISFICTTVCTNTFSAITHVNGSPINSNGQDVRLLKYPDPTVSGYEIFIDFKTNGICLVCRAINTDTYSSVETSDTICINGKGKNST